MLYVAMHFTVKKTTMRFKQTDYFPGMLINGTLATGEYATVYTSNPILMLFAIVCMYCESSWIVKGAMKVTPYLDRNNRPKIDYFVVPDSFMETLILKNFSKIKSTFNSVDVAIKYGFDIQKLKKIILGMTIFGGYQGAEPSPEVDLEERLKFFKEQLKFDYDNLKQVKSDVSEMFLPVLVARSMHEEEDLEISRPGVGFEGTSVAPAEPSSPKPKPSSSSDRKKIKS
ncbi:hypothetical protein PS15p_212030 [Mucor circinelloides]